jgi:SAM-dependent methyltransferase
MFFHRRLFNMLGFSGEKSYCPVCCTTDVAFNPLPDYYRQKATLHGYAHFGKGEMTALDTYSCAKCGSSDRERLYAYWLAKEIDAGAFSGFAKAIHFAPEKGLADYIRRSNAFANYQTADLMMEEANHKVDLMNLPFSDNSFDFFICSHVLEHVTDDRIAVGELFRITRRGGRGILMAPVITGLPKTIEDPSVLDEAGRWRLFGQNDHVRLYSHSDYVARITESGFLLQQLSQNHFGSGAFKMLGLKPSSILYVVTKP